MALRIALPIFAAAPFQGYSAWLHEELASVQARWVALLATDGLGYVFQTWEWNNTWQQTIGQRQGVKPQVIEIRDAADQTVMIFPLGVYRQSGLRVLRFLGDVVSDYRAPVLSRQVLETLSQAHFTALWQALERRIAGVDWIELRRMPAVLDGVVNPMCHLPGAQAAENAHGALLPDTMAAFQTRLTTRKLADMRRLMRQVSELGPVNIVTAHTPGPGWDQALLAVLAQKSRRWQETGSRDLFAVPGYAEFYRSMAFAPETGASVRVCSMSVGDDIVAAHWGASFRGRYYWILPTYADGQWKRYSCGRALMSAAIADSIEAGFAVFDLTVGDEAYKLDWTDHSLALYEYRRARTCAGKAVLVAQQAKAWARQQPWLKRLVGTVRTRLSGSKPAAGGG